MGDADSQYMMPVEEIENWMDEALNEMDDGLDSLFALMYALNRYTHKQISSEMAYWRRLKECFTALSIFVVPVVLAIWIASAGKEYTELDGSQEGFWLALLETVCTVLMFVSGVIGLPLYASKTLQMYFQEDNKTITTPSRRSHNNESQRSEEGCVEDDDGSSLPRDFVEGLSEIRRITNRRFMDSVRQDIERRLEQRTTNQPEETSDRSFESFASDSETFEATKVGENQSLVQQQQQSGREDSSFSESSVLQRELGDFCGLKLTILSNTPDLTVEIEGEKSDINNHHHPMENSKPVCNIQSTASNETRSDFNPQNIAEF